MYFSLSLHLSLSLYIYIYICIHIYVCNVYIHVYTYIYIYIYMTVAGCVVLRLSKLRPGLPGLRAIPVLSYPRRLQYQHIT